MFQYIFISINVVSMQRNRFAKIHPFDDKSNSNDIMTYEPQQSNRVKTHRRNRSAKIKPIHIKTSTENIVRFGTQQGTYLYLMRSMCPYQKYPYFKIGHIKSIHEVNYSVNFIVCLAKIEEVDLHKLHMFYNTNTRFAFGDNYTISLEFYNSFMAFITRYLKLDLAHIWINQMYDIDSSGNERINRIVFEQEHDQFECDEMYDTDNDNDNDNDTDSCISHI
jgi:hypothetical protein